MFFCFIMGRESIYKAVRGKLKCMWLSIYSLSVGSLSVDSFIIQQKNTAYDNSLGSVREVYLLCDRRVSE